MNIIKKLSVVILLVFSILSISGCNNQEEQPIDNQQPTDKPSYDFSSLFKQDIVSRVDGVKKEWNKVSNFIINNSKYHEDMKEYDVVMINPNLWNEEDVKRLSDAGTYVFASVSLGEDDAIKYNKDGNYNDYYILDGFGKPTVNQDFNTYYVDIRKPSWQTTIIEKITQLHTIGVDGILMDNIDTIEKYPETKDGMITFIRRIKKSFPNLKLIANGGLEILPSVSTNLSGIVFEEFISTYDLNSGIAQMKNEAELLDSYQIAVEEINEIRKYKYFPVFALNYVNEYEFDYRSQIYYDICWEYDFIPYTSFDYMLTNVSKANVEITTTRGVKALDTNYQVEPIKEEVFSFLPLFQRETITKINEEKKPWNQVSSYICYYGQYVDKLTEFDVAIIEARWWKPEDVKRLTDSGTYAIAYVSVGEDVTVNFDNQGNYSDYYIFDETGKPTKNGTWNSYFVDASKESWQVKVLDQVKALVNKGVDGIFMDTIDTAVAFEDTKEGMVSLIRRIKKEFPHIKLVANRGFELLPEISSSISGLMYESFSAGYDFTNNMATVKTEEQLARSIKRAIEVVNEVRKYNYFPVFALDYVNEFEYDSRSQIYYNTSWEYDFISYTTYDILLATACKPNVELQTVRGNKALG